MLNPRETQALSNVLAYLWADERKDAMGANGEKHIFDDLKVLSQVKEREMCHAEPPDEICPGCGAHMQATHHPDCRGRSDPPAAYEVASDPEAVAYHQAKNRKQNILRNLVQLAGLDGWKQTGGPVNELVLTALHDNARDTDVCIAEAALDIILKRRDLDDEIPF